MADDDIGALTRLLAQEVPEIAGGGIEIKAIARNPGNRTKPANRSRGNVGAEGVDSAG
jgi:transcription antitermination factor NusA-like protein